MQPIPRSRQINVRIPVGLGKGAQVAFPVESYLRDKRIIGIESIANTALVTADNGTAVATPAQLTFASLTLVDTKSDEVHKGVPAFFLAPNENFGIYRDIEPVVIDWQKSFVKLTDAPANVAVFTYAFLVHYLP